MSNVFLKNTTASAITVAGFTVYYIDSADAEIVEVEGTAGGPLPSVGDTVMFGNYPQATSTPEPIEWTVLAVDSTNWKALLIAKNILDGKTYGEYSADTRWSNCSLREWLNSTFKTTAFDSSEQERIILSHIQNPSNSSTATSGGVDTDDYLFCLSIGEVKNTSYFSDNEARKCGVTQHAIDAGVNVSYGNSEWWLRSPGNYNIRAAYVYDSGGVNISGDYVYETFGVRPAMWVSFSGALTFKYNAFKYSMNGTPYWYVIDGTHSVWTDDLNAWGYTEVQPVATLPTVSINNDLGEYNWISATSTEYVSVQSQGVVSPTSTYTYDSTKCYAAVRWNTDNGVLGGHVDVELVENNGNIALKNISSNEIKLNAVRVAVCSDGTVNVVFVYDANKDGFNAFVYESNGTIYYYVLDGTQTEWTDDLSSIGYSLIVPISRSGDYGSSNILSANTSGGSMNISPNSSSYNSPYISGTTSTAGYKWSRVYATVYGYKTNGGDEIDPTVLGYTLNGNALFWKNLSDSQITVSWAQVALCSNPCATVVAVYNSSNVAYNAFKYTANSTDYYYVFDGTQTDWTDDLVSIGYYPSEVEILLGFKWNSDQTELVAVSDLSYDYYWTRVITQKDKDLLALMGIWANTSYKYGSLKSGTYTYTFVAIYSDIGETIASSYDITRFQIRDYVSSVGTIKGLWYDATATSSAMTWKCRITKNS